MDLAIHKVAEKQPAQGFPNPPAGELIRSYGLRPDLFAVANVYSESPAGGAVAYAKGAVEAIAELCHLSADQLTDIQAQADQLAHEGIRVLGLAKTGLLPVGQVRGLPDSPRELPFEYGG